jgi:hypothetical protein
VLEKTELRLIPPAKTKEARARGKPMREVPLGAGQPELM